MKKVTKGFITSTAIALTTSVLACIEHDCSITICFIGSIIFVFLVTVMSSTID